MKLQRTTVGCTRFIYWESGALLVTSARLRRYGESHAKRLTAQLFYALGKYLGDHEHPLPQGSFILMDQRVCRFVCAWQHSDRLLQALIACCPVERTVTLFERPGRAAGKTKFKFGDMLHLAHRYFRYHSFLYTTLLTTIGLVLSLGAAIIFFKAIGEGSPMGLLFSVLLGVMAGVLLIAAVQWEAYRSLLRLGAGEAEADARWQQDRGQNVANAGKQDVA